MLCFPQLGLRATWRPRKMRCKQVTHWQYSQDLRPHCLQWPHWPPLAPSVGCATLEWKGSTRQLPHFCCRSCTVGNDSEIITLLEIRLLCRVVPVLKDPLPPLQSVSLFIFFSHNTKVVKPQSTSQTNPLQEPHERKRRISPCW